MVDSVILKIKNRFGKIKINRGKGHHFTGMDISLKENGALHILMKEYNKERIIDFGEEMNKSTNIPEKHDMFTICESEPLESDNVEIFHHIVAKLLYACKRETVDIELVISFLYTRVSYIMDKNWEKLRRLLHYLQATINMIKIIGGNGVYIL